MPPKGILLFDLAGPARAPAGPPQRSFVEGPDWAVLVEADADERKTILTRRMTAFRLHDEGYRRSHEVHYLRLMDPEDVTTLVKPIGFTVETFSDYGEHPLPQGVTGFLARKSIT